MRRTLDRAGWAVAGALGVALLMSIASVARGGSLDPTAPPGSTMRTLDQVIGAWDRKLDSTNGVAGPSPPAGCNSSRFKCVYPRQVGCAPICLLTYDGVLDLETGLVWERVPSDSTRSWAGAFDWCLRDNDTGGRRWRVPTASEFASLEDPSVTTAPTLPPGSPFGGIGSSTFWTQSPSRFTDNLAMAFEFIPFASAGDNDKSIQLRVWCVRGPGTGTDY